MLTSQELYANYFYWIITYIAQNSDPECTDFVKSGETFTFNIDYSDGSYNITSWSNPNCTQPTNEELINTYNPDDYIPYMNAYQLQFTSMIVPSAKNSDLPTINQNQGIPKYTLLYNEDTSSLMFKISTSQWVLLKNFTEPDIVLEAPTGVLRESKMTKTVVSDYVKLQSTVTTITPEPPKNSKDSRSSSFDTTIDGDYLDLSGLDIGDA